MVVERDLTAETMPHLSLPAAGGRGDPGGTRSAGGAAARLADAHIAEVGRPGHRAGGAMYNFSILHAEGLDRPYHPLRPNLQLQRRGAEGLLRGRKVFVVTGRGLVYGDSSPGKDMDFQAPYLRAMLAFLGLDDVTFIHLEGLKISPELAAGTLERARQAIGDLLPAATAA
jgi:FMN-dependent NADH-azoreductase